jgi:hypothetical protein
MGVNPAIQSAEKGALLKSLMSFLTSPVFWTFRRGFVSLKKLKTW